MKFQNLSVKRLFGWVVIGLVLSMSGITIALFFVTKQTAVLLTGGAMLLCALAVKLYDGGPVFYRQKRLTQGGREFEIYKFRSMIPDAESHGAQLAEEHDPRITPVGRFLRKCRLDELPQLLNILKGDMSVVGPRPERPELCAAYEKEFKS